MNDFVKYLQLWQRARIVLKIATTKICVASTRSALGQNSNICGGTLSDFHYPPHRRFQEILYFIVTRHTKRYNYFENDASSVRNEKYFQ